MGLDTRIWQALWAGAALAAGAARLLGPDAAGVVTLALGLTWAVAFVRRRGRDR